MDAKLGYVELASKEAMAHTIRMKMANFENIMRGQLSTGNPFAARLCFENFNLVSNVLLHATPFKVLWQVVCALAIFVVNLRFVRRGQSDESESNYAMRSKRDVLAVFAKSVKVIAVAIGCWFQDATDKGIMLRFNSLHTGKIGNLINAFKIKYIEPLFHAPNYRVVADHCLFPKEVL